ncbi:hypothetical protein [Paenimyroides viscosum]|uniref:Uncharacterized protein n=1 Tax=Paenimyroides viscosum TaxID=2488729 RepID=A0A3P1B4J3_9FLAO|nr:hypothetical protein [Paenimyroides viscosum]RRA95895.1 hypothetical protein EG242_04375 [Paenimyroides viscosum]
MNDRNTKFRESIGHKLKEYRLKNFLSIDDIVYMSEISKSSVLKAEKGTAKDIDLYVEYAKAVQYPLATLTDFNIPLIPINTLPKERLEAVNLTAKIREHIVNSRFLKAGKVVAEIKEELLRLKLIPKETTSQAVAGVMRNLKEDGLVATADKKGRKEVYLKYNE